MQVSPAWVRQALPLVAHIAFVPQACSVHAVAQQMLPTQAPLAQSLAAVQAPPLTTGGLHMLPMQTLPVAHTIAALAGVQLVLHMPPVQR